MIGICIKFDPAYNSLTRDQYYEMAKAFPDLVIFERGIPRLEKDNYCGYPITRVDNADDLPTEPTLVVMASQVGRHLKGEISLMDYVHPENAIYYFGDDHSHFTQEQIGITTKYDSVYIPVPHNLWSGQAVAITLYDRLIKNG